MRRVLAIHPGALGDVLLAVPALRALRAGAGALPVAARTGAGLTVDAPPRVGARLAIAAQPRIGALLVALGVVDDAVAVDTLGLDALFTDTPLAGHAPLGRYLAEGARIVCWFGARDAAFVARLRALAPDAVIAPPATPEGVVWQHLLSTTWGDVAGGDRKSSTDPAAAAPVVVTPALLDDGRRALQAIGWGGASPVLVVHPGAGGVAKRWPTDGFVTAVADVTATVVVHRGPADAEAVRAFVDRVRRSIVVLEDPSLPTLAGVLATAAAYLGNDSGVSHLAAAVGAPSLVLFARAAWPWRPWSATARCHTVTMSELVDAECRAVRAALGDLLSNAPAAERACRKRVAPPGAQRGATG